MAQLKLVTRNILETGAVTVTSENSSYPKYRLYDRDIGKLFKGNTTPANFYITVDQGSDTNYPVNRVIIPSGHNLAGLTLKIQYSIDNFSGDVNDADLWTGTAGLTSRSFTSQTKRYWRLNIASPSSVPELAELFLGMDYQFEQNPAAKIEIGDDENVYKDYTRSGKLRAVKFGEYRRYRRYVIPAFGTTQKTNLEDVIRNYVAEAKPFWMIDVDGVTLYVELINKPRFIALKADYIWTAEMEFLEVL